MGGPLPVPAPLEAPSLPLPGAGVSTTPVCSPGHHNGVLLGGKSGGFTPRTQATEGEQQADVQLLFLEGFLSTFQKMPCEAKLCKLRAPGVVSISKELTTQVLNPILGATSYPKCPSQTPAIHPASVPPLGPPPSPAPPKPYVALQGLRPLPLPPRGLSRPPQPPPHVHSQPSKAYRLTPKQGWGSKPGGVPAGPGGCSRRGRCCPRTPPRGPGGRRGRPGAKRAAGSEEV